MYKKHTGSIISGINANNIPFGIDTRILLILRNIDLKIQPMLDDNLINSIDERIPFEYINLGSNAIYG